MDILRIDDLNGHEFGADMVSGPELNQWLKDGGMPMLTRHFERCPDYVQIEAFLCAWESASVEGMKPTSVSVQPTSLYEARHARRQSAQDHHTANAEARDLLNKETRDWLRSQVGDVADDLSLWMLGAKRHEAMRNLLRHAFTAGDLLRLDSVTLRPVNQKQIELESAEAARTAAGTIPIDAAKREAQAACELQARLDQEAADEARRIAESRGRCVKRSALIAEHSHRWPKVERQLRDAASNGLSEAAKADKHGYWWEGSAIAWAKARHDYRTDESGLTRSVFHSVGH